MFQLLTYVGGGSQVSTIIMLVVLFIGFITIIRSKNNKITYTSPANKIQSNNISNEVFQEEKVLIKSENYNFKKIALAIFAIITVVLSRVILGLHGVAGAPMILVAALYGAIPAALIYWWLGSYQLVITNKRIYGRVAFGKRVDLPVDSVSATSTSAMKGIAIATSSGRLYFKLIKNRDEMHAAISGLLIERQNKPAAVTTIKQEIPQSNADELKKYKELLDQDIITQEEFDAKKKQLLGL